MDDSRLKIICLTPVKNEEWILERFLKATSLWADHIILADQSSTDRTVEIAKKFSKVLLIENTDQQFNEHNRQQLLLDKAREFPGKKLLIALDADEFFTANIFTSPEWQTVLNAQPGTFVRINWIHPFPRFNEAAEDIKVDYGVGYMDDGHPFTVKSAIHNPRLPIPANSQHIFLHAIKLLHYNLVDFDRDRSKKRWYITWEFLHRPKKAYRINRSYIHHHPLGKAIPFNREWIKAYEDAGIDMTSLKRSSQHFEFTNANVTKWQLEYEYWWDEEILNWMKEDGAEKFSKLDIWDNDWEMMGKIRFGAQTDFRRRASLKTRLILHFIRRTPNPGNNFFIEWLDNFMEWIY